MDAERGVWKAPAGTEARLYGTEGFVYQLDDAEQGSLEALGVNCLRALPRFGYLCWGARTLDGKYVAVRRLSLFLEQSIEQGTRWVVHEPNDEHLWQRIRLAVGQFMAALFRQGAFAGGASAEAFFVDCGRETMTQGDIDNGIVNIEIGFAPLRPAEFVVIRIRQKP
jgi:phage tail sheath protein FI